MRPDLAEIAWRRIGSEVLTKSLGLAPPQNVIIMTWSHALPSAERIMVEARRLGIRSLLLRVPDWPMHDRGKKTGPSDAIALSRADLGALAATDGLIYLPPTLDDLRRWDSLPASYRQAWEDREESFVRAIATHSVKSVYLMAGLVSEASSRLYDVDFQSWQRDCFRATTFSSSQIRRAARPIVRSLLRGKRLTITHPNGTHLELALRGYQPVVDDAKVDADDVAKGHNWTLFPGGYVAVALDGRIAEGRFVSNRPTHLAPGSLRGAEWVFRQGRLVGYSFARGKKVFDKIYRHAGRERNRPAIVEIGLNPRIHDFAPLEDLERGAVSLVLGHNEDYGGQIRGKFRHSATLRHATVSVDDAPLIRAGRL